ncbi:hypothetical protein M472_15415 [Sphingobacterium paucimobilis HER1398]|uniref:TonB-dependent receptor plug domain-containing protein n=1 Tax=Sphingobacterium paucimobilis HER1398 TaxID=1346330 RepID=U2HEG9_9SPHI|nr:hypothetical protein M472_15415 [Sphingobacterium paucimobilis HER1398]
MAQERTQPLDSRTVSGMIRNNADESVANATIVLRTKTDSLTTRTNKFGTFSFAKVSHAEFTVSVSHIAYGTFTQRYLMNDLKPILTIPPVILKKENVIEEVHIAREGPSFKKDTVEFWAQDYIVRDYARLADLLKRIPGVMVQNDGRVFFNGQEIRNAKFNGVNYFSGNVNAIIKELPADIVERVQIIDDYGDESQGEVKRDEAIKTLNVVTKPDKSAGRMYNIMSEVTDKERYKAEYGYKSIDYTDQKSFKLQASRSPLGIAPFVAVGIVADRQ